MTSMDIDLSRRLMAMPEAARDDLMDFLDPSARFGGSVEALMDALFASRDSQRGPGIAIAS